jgi:hypothetical protein
MRIRCVVAEHDTVRPACLTFSYRSARSPAPRLVRSRVARATADTSQRFPDKPPGRALPPAPSRWPWDPSSARPNCPAPRGPHVDERPRLGEVAAGCECVGLEPHGREHCPGYTMVYRATPMLTHRSALVSARGCGAGLAGARHSMQSGTRQPSWSGRGPHPDAQIPRRSHKDSRGPHKCTGSTSNGCVGSAQG